MPKSWRWGEPSTPAVSMLEFSCSLSWVLFHFHLILYSSPWAAIPPINSCSSISLQWDVIAICYLQPQIPSLYLPPSLICLVPGRKLKVGQNFGFVFFFPSQKEFRLAKHIVAGEWACERLILFEFFWRCSTAFETWWLWGKPFRV